MARKFSDFEEHMFTRDMDFTKPHQCIRCGTTVYPVGGSTLATILKTLDYHVELGQELWADDETDILCSSRKVGAAFHIVPFCQDVL